MSERSPVRILESFPAYQRQCRAVVCGYQWERPWALSLIPNRFSCDRQGRHYKDRLSVADSPSALTQSKVSNPSPRTASWSPYDCSSSMRIRPVMPTSRHSDRVEDKTRQTATFCVSALVRIFFNGPCGLFSHGELAQRMLKMSNRYVRCARHAVGRDNRIFMLAT